MASVGIRREDKNEWERRAPLTPDHVAELVEAHGISFVVQPSARRTFPDKDYRTAGAELSEDLGGCAVILGVKEIPPEKLIPGRTHVFFSHTTKGQAYNMPLLRRVLDARCTLIDYEHIVDGDGRRLIFFGRHAGHAGMVDALWALGRRLAAEGLSTPFERLRLAHDYSSLDEATHHVSRVGERIRHTGLPEALRPIVCGFTGSGNVSRGALEIFDRLPWIELFPEELGTLATDAERPKNVVYRVYFPRASRYERVEGGPVDLDELDRHPERYRGALGRYLPHLTMITHGAFWNPAQPRLLTIADLRRYWRDAARPRLRVIADISCDVRGGIESTLKVATPGDPVYVFDVENETAIDGVRGNGPVILAVDNLPCQFPVESSEHFGDLLSRFLPALANADWGRPIDDLELPPAVARAVVTHQGGLTSAFDNLRELLGEGG